MQQFYPYGKPTVSFGSFTLPPLASEAPVAAPTPEPRRKLNTIEAAAVKFGHALVNGNTAVGMRERFDTASVFHRDRPFWDKVMERAFPLVHLRLMVPAATGVIAFTDTVAPEASTEFWAQVITGQCGSLGTSSAAWKHREWLRMYAKSDRDEQAIYSLGRFAAFLRGNSKMMVLPPDLASAMAMVREAAAA